MNVVLLYDFDPQWTPGEKDEIAAAHQRLTESLSSAGFSVDLIPVVDPCFPEQLSSYDSRQCVLFNWCDGIPGLRHSEYMVVRQLEQLGFVFTGSGSDTLFLSYDKLRVKKIWIERGFRRLAGVCTIHRKATAGMNFRQSSSRPPVTAVSG
jgi:D-alanine-D-alanine ligase-like ATP-grasp enzyme